MSYVIFHNEGYDYFDTGNYVLFSSDNTHNALFNYAAADLSSLSELFEKYIASKIDTKTFKLIKHSSDSSDGISEIIELMKSLHPFYKYEYKKVIVRAIGEYLNNLLLDSVYNLCTLNPQLPIQEEWYHSLFTGLMPSFIQEQNGYYPDGLYPNDFFHEYCNCINYRNFDTRKIEESVLFCPPKTPFIFSHELITQKIVQEMLYFILDANAEGLNKLSISQRIWFYSNLFYMSDSKIHMQTIKHLMYMPPILYKIKNEKDNADNTNEYEKKVEYRRKMYDLFMPIYMLNDLSTEYENISKLFPDNFNAAIEYAQNAETSKIYEKYEINSLRELLIQEITFMIQNDVKIKKCKNCGRYFSSKKSSKKYCDQLFQNTGKACCQIGRTRQYQEKKAADPINKLYESIYNKHRSRVRIDIHDTQNAFEQWSREASSMRQKHKSGELSTKEFIKWLHDTTP